MSAYVKMSTRKRLLIVLLVLFVPPLLSGAIIVGVVAALDRTTGAIISSGEKREYLLHVPKSYDRTKATPLVISLHGAMGWPAFEMKITQWNLAADANGFIVVYPGGKGIGPKTWFMGGARTPSRMPDVRFISDLIDTLEAKYNIDPAMIYANGLSNGGGMAFVLSCTLSNRIAAIGAVSAAQSLPFSWCPDSTAVPMIAFHGRKDPIVPYEGGKVWIAPEPFPNVPSWVASWARRNHCASDPVDSAVAAAVIRSAYTECANDATVVLYTMEQGGHEWPGGMPLPEWLLGPTSHGINATNVTWTFFREHKLRR